MSSRSSRCFEAVEKIEKPNNGLLMLHQFNAALLRNMLANHIWKYGRCLTARHREAARQIMFIEIDNFVSFLLRQLFFFTRSSKGTFLYSFQ